MHDLKLRHFMKIKGLNQKELAARESMVTAERTRRGMRGNALKCRHNGDRVYGCKVVDGKYEINEDEAPIVREEFRMRMEREPVAAIAKRLAALGVRYEYYRCGAKCGAPTVRRDELEGFIAAAIRAMLEGD